MPEGEDKPQRRGRKPGRRPGAGKSRLTQTDESDAGEVLRPDLGDGTQPLLSGRTMSDNPMRLVEQLSHKFHLLDNSVTKLEQQTGGKMSRPMVNLQGAIDRIGALKTGVSGELAGAISDVETQLSSVLDDVRSQGEQQSAASLQQVSEARRLLGDIKASAALLPSLGAVLGLPKEPVLTEARPLPKIVEPRSVALTTTARPVPFFDAVGYARTGPTRIVGFAESEDGVRVVETAPARHKIHVQIEGAVSGRPAERTAVQIYGVTLQDGRVSVEPAAAASTNERGLLTAELPDQMLSRFDRLALVVGERKREDILGALRSEPDEGGESPVLPGVSFLDTGGLRGELKLKQPHRFLVPEGLLDRFRGTATLDPTPVEPDASDLQLDPAIFSFDDHLEDGARCLKSRPEVSPRNFFFSQLVRTEEAELVSANKPFERTDVTAPIPLDDINDRAESLSVVGANLVHGKLITFRQFWSPAAQGLGKLLYSLALSPREEVKLAVIDWSRTERSSRTDTIQASERLSADIERDTEVEDIVRSSITEEVEGGSEAESSTKADNKPKAGAYAAGAAAGFLLGGVPGAILGLAATHFIRPNTGASSDVSNTNWTNGMREIALDATKSVSDRVSQTASSMRDYRASVVTTVSERERETVRTRTVRNHNQNHAMTVQYYQVLQHYHVITEAQSEQDVVFVPYAIDERIFAELPDQSKFFAAPRAYAIAQFALRHFDALWRISPRSVRPGLEALRRIVFDNDEYREQIVTASRWQVNAAVPIPQDVSVYLDTLAGRVRLSPLGGSGQEFSSRAVRLEDVGSLVLHLDVDRYTSRLLNEALKNVPDAALTLMGDTLAEMIRDRIEVSIDIGKVQLRATADRRWFSSDERFHLFPRASSSIKLSKENPQATLSLDAVDSDALAVLIDEKVTRQGRDYERFEDFVIWMQRQPMRVLQNIWMLEDPGERALRFDRYKYGDGSLLNNIDNRPVGVEGNYVAFPLARGKSVNAPIDLSNIRTERAISVPTRGVFAEVYLSCNNATERRDITRRIDVDYVTPFAAPEISPIATGSRSRATAPGQGGLPASIISIQGAPTAPVTNPEAYLASTVAPSPFPNLSHGAAAIAAAQDLTKQALTVDAAKQKSYLDAATAILEGAGNAALIAAGLPPVLDFDSSGNASLIDPSVTGKAVRDSDAAAKYDHVVADMAAKQMGAVSDETQKTASAQNLGVSGSDPAPDRNEGTGGANEDDSTTPTTKPTNPAPRTDQYVIQISPTELLLFNFDTNKSSLKPAHIGALKVAASKIAGPDSIITVWGMASPLGSEASNQTLSAARSKTVFDALLEYSANQRHPGPFNEPAIVTSTGERESFRLLYPDNAEIAAIPGGGHENDAINRGVLVVLGEAVDVEEEPEEIPIDDDHPCQLIGKCIFLGDTIIDADATVVIDDSETDNRQIMVIEDNGTTIINEGDTHTVTNGDRTYQLFGDIDFSLTVTTGDTDNSVTFMKPTGSQDVRPVDGGTGGALPKTSQWLIDVLNPKLEGGRNLETFLREAFQTAFGDIEDDMADSGFNFFGESFSGAQDEVIDFLVDTALEKLKSAVGGTALALVNAIEIGSITAEATFRRADRQDEVAGTIRGPGLVIGVLDDGGATHQILSDGPYKLDTTYSLGEWSGTHREFFYVDTAIDGTIRTIATFVGDLINHFSALVGAGFVGSGAEAALEQLSSLASRLGGLGTGVGFRARDGQLETYGPPHAITTFSIRALSIQSGSVNFRPG